MKAVIAVACERDLTEGIIDVKGIPGLVSTMKDLMDLVFTLG